MPPNNVRLLKVVVDKKARTTNGISFSEEKVRLSVGETPTIDFTFLLFFYPVKWAFEMIKGVKIYKLKIKIEIKTIYKINSIKI